MQNAQKTLHRNESALCSLHTYVLLARITTKSNVVHLIPLKLVFANIFRIYYYFLSLYIFFLCLEVLSVCFWKPFLPILINQKVWNMLILSQPSSIHNSHCDQMLSKNARLWKDVYQKSKRHFVASLISDNVEQL